MKKNYYEMFNVGTTKYLVNFHDGVSTHRDGSAFYDIALFSNKLKKTQFVSSLSDQGYVERRYLKK